MTVGFVIKKGPYGLWKGDRHRWPPEPTILLAP
jgi:hypothetical protein